MGHVASRSPQVNGCHRPHLLLGVAVPAAQQGGAIGGIRVKTQQQAFLVKKEVVLKLKDQ